MQNLDAIKELKQLLDTGLIKQEEYDRKKAELLDAASVPPSAYQATQTGTPSIPASSNHTVKKSKIVAGLTGIFLGGFGVHKFYLGYASQGAILLAVTLGLSLPVTMVVHASRIIPLIQLVGILKYIPVLVGIVEGVIYLTRSDEDFQRIYATGQRGWF